MKKIASTVFLAALIFFSCEKETGNPYILKFYGDAFEDIGYSVSIASDGYIIAGQLENIKRIDGVIADTTANKNMGIIKTDWQGNIKWKVSLGGRKNDVARKLYKLEDDSLLCVGTLEDTTNLGYKKEVFVAKLSAKGKVKWKKAYGGTGNQEGIDVVKTSYGFMVLGSTDVERPPVGNYTGNVDGKLDFYLLKLDNEGNELFSFGNGFWGNDYPSAIKLEQGDNCIVLGTTDLSQAETGQGQMNLMMFQVYPSGMSAGQNRIIGTVDDEYAADIEILPDGYLVSGTVGAKGTEQEALVVKIRKDIASKDAVIFSKKFRINDASTAVNAMAPYGAGNYVLAGNTGVYPFTKMLVFEMDPAGNPVTGNTMIRGSSGEQAAYDVVSGDDRYIIAVGKSRYDINTMISFLKFKF
jgi:hypothetical protein